MHYEKLMRVLSLRCPMAVEKAAMIQFNSSDLKVLIWIRPVQSVIRKKNKTQGHICSLKQQTYIDCVPYDGILLLRGGDGRVHLSSL